jgi:predicted enzyme related to lactoylglutathione lyase
MKRVTGIGGVFFKCKDPEKVKEWYKKHLGIPSDQYGGMFQWRKMSDPEQTGSTVWGPFPEQTEYFAPSEKPYMFNYRVQNLEKLLDVLKEEGVEIVGKMESYDYGKFGWIMDPEGNKVELWEPVDGKFSGTALDMD